MHVPADEAVAQGPHGIGKDVTADSLHNVLDELRTVAFDSAPLLLGVNPHICDGLSSETVLSDPWLHVGQPASGGQGDEQHPVFHQESDVTDLGLRPLFDRVLHGGIDGPPVRGDVGIAAAPHVHQRLELVFGQAHVESAHRFKGTDAAAIAEGELGDFAFLPEVAVLAVLFHDAAKHPAGTLAINITAFAEDLSPPFLMGKMAQDPRLNRTEVADDELVAGTRNERGPDQFRQHAGDGIVQQIQHFIVTSLHQIPRLLQIVHVILR